MVPLDNKKMKDNVFSTSHTLIDRRDTAQMMWTRCSDEYAYRKHELRPSLYTILLKNYAPTERI